MQREICFTNFNHNVGRNFLRENPAHIKHKGVE